MVKKKSGLMGIKAKSDRIKNIPKNYSTYKSTFEYEKFDLGDISDSLKKSEEKIYENLLNIDKSTFDIAEELYKVNKELANRGNGSYMAWCSALGINKDRSSILLKKYNLYLLTNKKETMELPIPVVKVLTSKKNQLTDIDILEVVRAEKPSQKLKEFKKSYSQVANNWKENIIEAEIVESEEDKKKRLELELKKINKDIKERERNLKKLKKEREKLLEEINGG